MGSFIRAVAICVTSIIAVDLIYKGVNKVSEMKSKE